MFLKSGIDPVYNRLDIFVNDPTVRLSVLNDDDGEVGISGEV